MEVVLYDRDAMEAGLINPESGEVIDLAGVTREQLAEWYLAMLRLQEDAAKAVRFAGRLFADLSDRETTLSVTVGERRVSVPSNALIFEPDLPALREALDELVNDGTLSERAADDTCRPNGVRCPACDTFVPTGGFKLSPKALTALRKTSDRVNTIIDACGQYMPPVRSFKSSKL